ncbi:MAG: hypothetical protein JW915_08480 [Chitinispirillaceae bacterium]|nr:hypothetical protein [Chitinispirillaceae bacterium]
MNKLKKCFCEDGFLALQTRFKSPSTDSIISRQIGKQQKLSLIRYFTVFGLKEYNRYDHILFLYNCKEQLLAEKDIRLEDEIKWTKPIIDDAISYLEKKKAANAPIGFTIGLAGR